MAQCKTSILLLGSVTTASGTGKVKSISELDEIARNEQDPSNPPPTITWNEVRSQRVEQVQDLVDGQNVKIGERRVGVQYTMEDATTGQRYVLNFDRS